MNKFSDKRKELFDNDLMGKLYNDKSKPIHCTLNDIISTFKAEIRENIILPIGFEYGESKDLHSVFETLKFFQSSIWTSIQGFLICILDFTVLSEEEMKPLLSLHDNFLNEALNRNKNLKEYF